MPTFDPPQDREDERRAASLRAQAQRDPANAEALRDLADRIDPKKARNPQTLASSRYLRDQRARVISAVWRLVHEAQWG